MIEPRETPQEAAKKAEKAKQEKEKNIKRLKTVVTILEEKREPIDRAEILAIVLILAKYVVELLDKPVEKK